jgi:hypothetical protein
MECRSVYEWPDSAEVVRLVGASLCNLSCFFFLTHHYEVRIPSSGSRETQSASSPPCRISRECRVSAYQLP